MTVTGVMLLENTHMRGPRSMAHPGSYSGRVLFETLPGVMGRVLVDQPHLVRERVIATARNLAARGAEIVTINCGFGALFQRELDEVIDATIVSSSLLLLPTVAAIHSGRVGIVTFDKAALSHAHLTSTGWPFATPACADVQRFAEWRLLDEERQIELPIEMMAKQLIETASPLINAHGLAAVVLECSGMVPFADLLRRELGCAVYTIFDALNLVSHGRNPS